MRLLKPIFFLLFLMAAFCSYGDIPRFNIKNLGVRDGLTNEYVLDIAEDGHGFIWIATDGGLYRFDGKSFLMFSTRNTELTSNSINCLYYDEEKDEMWFSSKLGLYILNCASLNIEHAKAKRLPDEVKLYNVNSIKRSRDKSFWLVNRHEDIVNYNPATGEVRTYNAANTDGLGDSFYDVEEDGAGNLLIANSINGLSSLNLATGKVRHFLHDENTANSLPGNIVECIHRDRTGRIWVGTNKGLALYDASSGSFRSFRHRNADANSLAGDHVYAISEMKDGHLWVACDVGGISIVNPMDSAIFNGDDLKFFNLLPDNSDDGNSLISPNVRPIFQDKFGNVWIGHYGSGLDFISHGARIFSSLSLGERLPGHQPRIAKSLLSNSDGTVWAGCEGEIILIKGRTIEKVFSLPTQSAVTAITRHEDKILLGLYEDGMLEFDPLSGNSRRLEMPLKKTTVHSILHLRDHRALIGTEQGLYLYDGGTISKLNNVPNPVKHLNIYSLATDRDGRIWVGTYGDGVFVFDYTFRLLDHVASSDRLVSNAIKHVYCDSRGWMWIAGQDGLTCMKDPHNFQGWVFYNYENGLDDIHTRAVHEDLWGHIWVSTNNGLSRWNKLTDRIENYDYHQGLPRSSFTDRSVAINNLGELYFSSLNGICIFNPKDVDIEQSTLSVVVAEIQLMGDLSNDGRIIPFPGDGKALKLPYEDNSFTIHFTMPDYSLLHSVEYAYQMEGIDDTWTPIKNNNQVTFRNLQPGEYKFSVRTRQRDQEWSESIVTTVRIVITPPLWLTWWAKLLYVILFLAAIVLGVRFYLNRMRLRNSLELERRKSASEQELNNERLRFFTNITHELRTPLTLIIGPLEDLVSDKTLDEAHRSQVSLIHKSSVRLLNLINQILEFRKTQTQNRQLSVSYGKPSTVVKELGIRFKELNRNDSVSLDIEVDDSVGECYYDPDIVNIIISNLLSNAFKYTKEGRIVLAMTDKHDAEGDWVEISVSDTGYGIARDALPYVFDRYYQAKGKHQASGTGIGLALAKSLAELHHGRLTVESVEGKGSIFRFDIPLAETYPDAVHNQATTPVQHDKRSDIEEATSQESDARLSVLIVEDNEDIRKYVSDTLGDSYRIITAQDGKEGLDKAREYMPDVIVSDIMMPVMDGIELCRAVKSSIATSHIPVILLTAKDSLHDKEEGYDSGADSYLTKPFSAKLLQRRIENLIESRRRLAAFFAGASVAKAEKDEDITIGEQSEPMVLSKLDEEFLTKFRKLVDENIANDSLDMGFIQDKMNMSHSTFYRKIKALTGISGNEYVRKIRLNHASRMLSNGYSVSETAYSCGFNDIVYFRKCFKNEFGVSPSQYSKSGSENT